MLFPKYSLTQIRITLILILVLIKTTEKVVKHESERNTNCSWSPYNGKETEVNGYQKRIETI